MNNELEESEQQNEKKKKQIKEGLIESKLLIVVMIILLLTFLSIFYILNEMFANHKTFSNSVSSLINFVKINWWKYFLGYGSFIAIYILGAIAHLKIIKKKGMKEMKKPDGKQVSGLEAKLMMRKTLFFLRYLKRLRKE